MSQKRKNQKDPFETLNDNDVTKSWIKNNYDLDAHRSTVETTDSILTQEAFDGDLSKKQVTNLRKILIEHPDAWIRMEERTWDGFELMVLVDMTRPMTDTEVTDKLQKQIKKTVRKEREKAKKHKEEEKIKQRQREMEERASEVQIDI